jgi:hypothetical protein
LIPAFCILLLLLLRCGEVLGITSSAAVHQRLSTSFCTAAAGIASAAAGEAAANTWAAVSQGLA